MKRVVITGLGMVSPLAVGAVESWRRLLNCESGIKKIKSFDVSDLVCKIAGQVPSEHVEQKADTLFDPLNYMTARELNRMDTFIVYAIAAASEAIADSGVDSFNDAEKERTGVLIGSGIGGLPAIYETSVNMHENGARRVSPFFIPSSLIIQVGSTDVMVAGGTEAAVCRAGIAGFSAARALSTARNDTPEEASRPWDKSRDGFIMAEGSGIVVLEEMDHAIKRGAKIYGEVVGYGMSGDAYHVTAPLADGDGAYRAMREALRSANLSHDDIDYINAHGTSTPAGDIGELRAVERLLGEGTKASMSSTKSAIGHLLGAAGAVEAIFSILAMRDQVAPATLNLHDSEETFLDLVPLQPKQRKIEYAMSNSFGFGGTNASLIVKKF